MVKGGKYSIHGSIVTQKCIETSFHSYFKVFDYPIFTIYPRKVAEFCRAHYGKSLKSRYLKKKESIQTILSLINSLHLNFSRAARRNWEGNQKKDDLADCILLTLYFLNKGQ
jgi:hypothetical protein